MIPRRLHLRNFLSYRECTVDLTGLHLAVLCGRNGDGKSALLDAMTWALWGEGRGRVEDDRIHLAEQEMLVDFTFEVDGDVFTVVRKRTRGRGTGSLEFMQVDSAGRRVPRTGGTIRETQAELNRRLRMDYETFVNSAFVAQGRANEFTRKNASERKEVFRKILGLERYEELATLANDRKKDAVARLAQLGRAIEEAQEAVAGLPAVEAELASVAARAAELAPSVVCLEGEVGELRQAAADYERLQREEAEALKRAGEAAAAVAACDGEIKRLNTELAAVRETLAQADEITARHRQLIEAREAEQALAERQTKAREQERVVEQTSAAIGEERVRIEGRLEALRRDVANAEAALASLPGLWALEAALTGEQQAITDLDAAIDAARASEGELRERAATARAGAEQFKAQAVELKAREAQLDGAAICPVCRKPLAPGDVEHVRGEYAEQRRALGVRYNDALAAGAEAEREAEAQRSSTTTLQADRQGRAAALHERERDLHGRLPAALEAERILPAARAAVVQAEASLGGSCYAPEARARLAEAQTGLASIGYDPEEHAKQRALVRDLAGAEQAFRECALAAERAEGLERSLAREAGNLEERRSTLALCQAALVAAREALAAATDVGPRLTAADAALAGLRAEQAECARSQGRLEQRREQLLALRAKIETAADETRAAKDEEQTYGDLALAFGKNGVQAMLIDQALPRVEIIANGMLDRMTGGRIQVALHTQRQNLKGGVQETLDIRISDDLGTRDYEMYSGGEAFRVDFALRIALSRLLAERAGASLPTLIIDEGFGTQDQEGIDRLVEGINAVASEFQLILVVTHIEELKGRFDRRIEVTKDLTRGSIAVVV